MNTKKVFKFGNWVPVKMIVAPMLLGIICLMLGVVTNGLFFIPAMLFMAVAVYFATAWHLFSPGGLNIQSRVQDLVVSHISWKGSGKALDIGCGNGPLTIKLALRFPEAEITGVDFWGKNWDYSMLTCLENARLAGVDGRVTFKKASASALPFEDNHFDLVVSNLVFHEVQDVTDKRQSIREALRVLKPGGVFVLQDLFLLKPYYGTSEELVNVIYQWGMKKVNFTRTCDESFIPNLVKLPFMLGTLAIVHGVK
ncbi:MAG: class I SAM-dependent methyltransferase [Anaerolineae bacterium]|nr:class I SAM-dependent methyltransferase [Anaerolineae bacterium]